MADNIADGLKDIIAHELDLNVKRDELDTQTKLLENDSFHIDSLALMELIALIEERFGFEFGEDELNLEPFESIGTLTVFVSERTSTTPA